MGITSGVKKYNGIIFARRHFCSAGGDNIWCKEIKWNNICKKVFSFCFPGKRVCFSKRCIAA